MSKILIVDDEEAIVRMLKFALSKEGFSIVTAGNGREGLQAAQNERPGLIISDIMMPEMDGLEMCRQIREMPELSNVPFIFLTAKADMSTRIKGLQLGADDFIVKPIDFKKLMKQVRQMLSYDFASDTGLSEPELFQNVQLSGNFSTRKVSEVFQTIDGEKLTGKLYIDSEGENVCTITFYKGKFVDLDFRGRSGREAMLDFMDVAEGDFRFMVAPIAIDQSSEPEKISTLIMDWTARRAKQQEKKTQVVLKRSTVFEVVLVPDFFKLTANDEIQNVIKHIQIGGNFGYVLDRSGLDQDRIIKIFKYLLSKGILKEKV